jgi:hypothetical protein
MFRRAGVFYAEETATGKQTSLRTKNEAEAITLPKTTWQKRLVNLWRRVNIEKRPTPLVGSKSNGKSQIILRARENDGLNHGII